MTGTDFEYDGQYLKNWGCMICYTDVSSNFETLDYVAQRTFDTISQHYGKKFGLTVSYYENRIEISFQICKYSCNTQMTYFTPYEIRELRRWLGRPKYHKFKLIQQNWSDYYLDGSFNISELQLGGKTYILELNFVSDSPFIKHEPIKQIIEINDPQKDKYTFFDISDEIGYIYPDIEIECLAEGDLDIHNSNEDRHTIIKNCKKSEKITFDDNLIMETSIPSHKIQNDFNYKFFRISNSYKSRKNIISSSIPVKITFIYSPYAKVVF